MLGPAGAAGAAGPAPAWQEHASGWVSFPDEAVEPIRDLDEVARRCAATEIVESEEELKRRLRLDLVEQAGRIRFTFGPRWRCLRSIRIGERRLLVTLQLDDAYRADLDRYPLHPALLDVAGAAARIHARDVYYLPLTYRSVRVWAGLTGTVYCDVQLKESADASGETLTCDMELLDPEGRPLVRVVDFSIKRINDVDGLVAQIERAAAAPADGPGHGTEGVLATLGEGMAAEDAVAAFDRLLRAPSVPERVLVSRRDVAALRRLADSITPALLAREVERLAPLGGTHPRPDLATPYTAPQAEEEKTVAAIWQEVLGVDRVGVEDDFFALGGHSLAAVQIGAKIRGRFGVDLDLREFFEAPTVAHTVAVLAAHAGGGTDSIPVLSRAEPDDVDGLAELSDDEVDARLRELLDTQPTVGEDVP
jgi:acyl carrier protein